MLKLPTNENAAMRVNGELHMLEHELPNTFAWLKAEELRILRSNAKQKDILGVRWNQGEAQLLGSLLKLIRDSRETHNNLIEGEQP